MVDGAGTFASLQFRNAQYDRRIQPLAFVLSNFRSALRRSCSMLNVLSVGTSICIYELFWMVNCWMLVSFLFLTVVRFPTILVDHRSVRDLSFNHFQGIIASRDSTGLTKISFEARSTPPNTYWTISKDFSYIKRFVPQSRQTSWQNDA